MYNSNNIRSRQVEHDFTQLGQILTSPIWKQLQGVCLPEHVLTRWRPFLTEIPNKPFNLNEFADTEKRHHLNRCKLENA